MATREQLPTQNFFPTVGSYDSILTAIKNRMTPGNLIIYSDINDLKSLINGWRTHYHRYDDRYQQATFGNTGNRNTLSEIKDTGVPLQQGTDLGIPLLENPPEIITRAYQLQLSAACNLLRSHEHNINDRTS